ncbi:MULTISPECIES: hypothetical protein [unclassified Clostridium]|uniref:hypothetical protein n=1 Tax=unclassified Clostridium TaxID=2614128 RepID=UPI0002981730|nr:MULTISPECIES: hypothetical protein [unclassified Clostridium]EKQ51580.1 MAG: hypothetical protein A370_04758 [Clostridium sp. Maddingley MBC34-26]
MKKFIAIFSIFLFLSFNINIITAVAESTKTFSQGFYRIKDLNLMPNTSYNIQNISSTTPVFVIVFNSNQQIQQSIRLEINSIKYPLAPLQFDYTIVVIGNGEVAFTP